MDNISINHGIQGDHEGSSGGGNVNIAKATAMACLFAGSFIIGNLPIKLNKLFRHKGDAKNNPHVKFLLGIGGGVLMCTTFIHLLPEVSESFEDFDIDISVEIPFAELLMCIGFFVMYFIEECVHYYLHQKEKKQNFKEIRRSLSIRRGELDEVFDSLENPKLKDPLQDFHGYNSHSHHADHSHVIHDFSEHSAVKTLRGLLIVLALSVHELFEGLAVGLESEAGTVWYMFGAVSAHKFVIAFCIGVELVTSMKTKFVIIYVFVFAVVSPIGIGIGLIITNTDQHSTALVSVILQGLATGTLLYVVFFEILQNDKKSGLRQYCSIFIGFAVMFTITTVLSV